MMDVILAHTTFSPTTSASGFKRKADFVVSLLLGIFKFLQVYRSLSVLRSSF